MSSKPNPEVLHAITASISQQPQPLQRILAEMLGWLLSLEKRVDEIDKHLMRIPERP